MLSFVVPCYDEETTLEQLHAAIGLSAAATGEEYEIVLVDDGSTDGTLAVIRALAATDPRVRYVSFSRNFGKESAMLAGLRHARGDAVILMDADLQHPPDLVPRMVELWRQGFDQVVARRNRKGDRFTRTVLSTLFYRLVNWYIDVRLMNGVGDFRLISRKVVDAVLEMPEYNRFSKALFSWVGFDIAMIEYENVARQGGGGTKWTFGKLLNYAMDGLISFNNRPLRAAIYLGLLMTGLTFVYLAWILVRVMFVGIESPGYVTLLAAVTGFGGLNMIVLGVIGEYVGRIYYETKRRPSFLVKEAELRPSAERTLDAHPGLQFQQVPLPRQATAETDQLAAGADHAVAGQHDR